MGAANAPTRAPVRWQAELMAGLAIWALLVPSAMAYASIAGVQPMAGLIGVPVALLAYGLFGGSRTLVVGADAGISVLVGSVAVSPALAVPPETGVLVVTVLAGLTYLVLRLLRFGWIADLIPQPVIKGFIQGLVIVTVVGQIPALLGLPAAHGGFFSKIRDIVASWGQLHLPSAVLGVSALVLLMTLSSRWPKVPAAIVALFLSGLVVGIGGLRDMGVSVVGEPASLVRAPGALSSIDLELVGALMPAALAIVVLGFTQSLAAAQLVTDHGGDKVDPDRELVGLGIANLAVGVVGSYAVTGTLSKTAVAVRSGATSRLANLFVAILAVLAALFMRPLFDYLANPVLAAVVVWALLQLLDLNYLRWLRSTSPREFLVAAVTGAGVFLFGVMPSVLIGCVLALALLARLLIRPPNDRMSLDADGDWRSLGAGEAPTGMPQGLVAVRLNGPLVYVNARIGSAQLLELSKDPGVRIIVLDASAITAVDSTGVAEASALVKTLRGRGQDLWLAGAGDRVRKRLATLVTQGAPRSFKNLDDALAAYLAEHPESASEDPALNN